MLTSPLFSVVSVSELGFSVVDQRASLGLFTDYVIQDNPVEQSLNLTRSHSADGTLEFLVLARRISFILKQNFFEICEHVNFL